MISWIAFAIAMGAGTDIKMWMWSLHTTHGKGSKLILASNAADVWPEAPGELRRQKRAPLFGAEDAVKESTDVGVGHGFLAGNCSAVPTGLHQKKTGP
ncbi:MAG TPA: hypothetical protein VNZ53_09305 [Steroidobacteraceae bacterium]|nr:hypothetical protein [Steroidobacteraceae bacterium]